MCGLVGIYSSNIQAKHKDVFSDLLYLDTFRGRDSTGVAAIRHNADTAVLKQTVPGYEFVEGPALGQHLKITDFCWIGHNRYGTVGRNIKNNAHPFMVDDKDGGCLLVGAHNGTLRNKWEMVDHQKFGTDSEAMFNNIAVQGLEATINKLDGAWAITYYDHVEEELRVIRNKERPLFYAFEEGRTTLIWASEMWMIRVACSRHGVKIEEDKVFSFAEDTLYRFPATSKLKEQLTIERKGGVVGKQPAPFFQHGQTSTGGPQTQQKTAPATQSSAAKTTSIVTTTQSSTQAQASGAPLVTKKSSSSGKLSVKQGNILNNVSNILSAKKFKGFQGESLSLKELETQLENGCSWCELEFIVPTDRFAWLDKSKPICHKCLDGTEEPSKKSSAIVLN